MLQTMALEIAPTALKAQTGGRSSSESAATPFTEIMAQTSLASAAQPDPVPAAGVPGANREPVQAASPARPEVHPGKEATQHANQANVAKNTPTSPEADLPEPADKAALAQSESQSASPASDGAEPGLAAEDERAAPGAEVSQSAWFQAAAFAAPVQAAMPQEASQQAVQSSENASPSVSVEIVAPMSAGPAAQVQAVPPSPAAVVPSPAGTANTQDLRPLPGLDPGTATLRPDTGRVSAPALAPSSDLGQANASASTTLPDLGRMSDSSSAPLPGLTQASDSASGPLPSPAQANASVSVSLPDLGLAAAPTAERPSGPDLAPLADRGRLPGQQGPGTTVTPPPSETAASSGQAPSEAIPPGIKQTIVLDAGAPAAADKLPAGSAPSSGAAVADASGAAGQATASTAASLEAAGDLPGTSLVLLKPAENAESPSVITNPAQEPEAGPAAPAAGPQAEQADLVLARSGQVKGHAPLASSTQDDVSGTVPTMKQDLPGEKGLQQSASNSGESGVPWSSASQTSDGPKAREAQVAPGGTFAQPMSEALRATADPSRAETAAARSNPVFAQVEGSVRWILQNKSQEAELQLHPDSLGRVTVQLRVEGQEVHARLWASEPSSMAVLQEHKASLAASLKEQGLSLGSFDLHFGARHDQPQTASQAWSTDSHAGASFSGTKQEIPSRRASPGLIESMDPHQIEVYA